MNYDLLSNPDSLEVWARRLFRCPRGPSGFGSGTFAEEVSNAYGHLIHPPNMESPRLLALVTGPSLGGIGFVTALELARVGCRVVLAGRSQDKLDAAAEQLRREVPDAQVETLIVDLLSFASVRTAAQTFLKRHDRLNILVNNAGIMARPFSLSTDGWEQQFAACHLGHFLLTELLMPALRAAARTPSSPDAPPSISMARVVNVSSVGHRAVRRLPRDTLFDATAVNRAEGYSPFAAYARAKLANIIHARMVAEREARKGTGVVAVSLMPGAILTHLGDHIVSVPDMVKNATRFIPGLKGQHQGAATSVFCAIAPRVARHSGAYFEDCSVNPCTHPFATDSTTARALWSLSSQVTGVGGGDEDPFALA
eukprot:TRINITY_DN68773_c0_g1_i1.p1 TRINITY_DN68773_c0_g1~~TRINITY_DN68773_c0_g1_i1.p1  ORF type:complete len:368 (+),score=64.89 TRINITY_DN68773_c0_g1_i1:91-1194(+)